jgi:hypothetical protein
MRQRHLRSAITHGLIGVALAACTVPNKNRRKDASVDDTSDASTDAPPATCTQTTCADDKLTVCVAGTVDRVESCPLGCSSDQSRCNKIVPSNGLSDVLDQAALLTATTLPAGSIIDSDSGVVTAAGTPLVVSTTTVAQSGGPTLRVLLARSWTLNGIRIQGSLPVAFVAADDIKIQGLIDASADTSTNGPGALICGNSGGGGQAEGFYERPRAGSSPGYPAFLWCSNGLGGGGFGSVGGAGGVRNASLKIGAAGATNGNAELVPLRGGCEGGGGDPQHRGAGGGAVQFVSGRTVQLLASGTDSGAIHVGGGGGAAGALGTAPVWGPGGGGSGGGILIEAASVVLHEKAMLLAAGGGGGGYGACNPGPDGVDAAPTSAAVLGGICAPSANPTSQGGEGATTGAGGTGQNAERDGNKGGAAGGGGGGLGRIRINTAAGQYSANASVVRGVVTTGMVGRR